MHAALGGVLTFFFHHDSDFPEILRFTHDTNDRFGCACAAPLLCTCHCACLNQCDVLLGAAAASC